MAFLAFVALASDARSEPREIPARVVWASGDRAYVASTDTMALERGLRITFRDRRREVASGEVTQVVDACLASVRLASGSLAGIRRPDRVRVFADRPEAPPLRSLRVGVPAPARPNLAFACGDPRPGALADLYRAESLAVDAWRWVRVAATAERSAWPETLFVRSFRDFSDEEVALERGDLDVAVFWPGELPTRMRQDARWRDAARGTRSRGLLAAVSEAGAPAAAQDPNLTSLNEQMFGGDLLPWAELDPGASASPADEMRTGAPSARYAVDAALPGHAALERYLNRAAPPAGRGVRTIRLAYLDVPIAARDSLGGDWRDRGVRPLYAIRCPVLCAPELRARVLGLGPDALADLPVCGPPRP